MRNGRTARAHDSSKDEDMSSVVPACVLELHRKMKAIGRRHDRVVSDLLPAPVAVRALIGYFKERLRVEGSFHRSVRLPRMDPDWYVRYSPSSHFHSLRFEERQRMYAYLLKVLQAHAPTLSRLPNGWRDPNHTAVRGRVWHAPEALAAVGAWWMEVNRESVRPRVTKRERKAFELCAKIKRILSRDAEEINVKRFTKALEWENRMMSKMLREDKKRKEHRGS